MTVFEVFNLPKQWGKQVYQVQTNERIFFVLFSKKEPIDETVLLKYLNAKEKIEVIKKAIDVILPVEDKQDVS